MIGDVAKNALIENAVNFSKNVRVCVNIKGIPLGEFDSPLTNPDCFYTYLTWSVMYEPYKYGHCEDNPFFIKCDLFKIGIRVKDYNELVDIAYGRKKPHKSNHREERIQEKAKYIVENTTISPEIFKVCKKHLSMFLPFSIRYDKIQDVNNMFISESMQEQLVERLKLKYGWNGELT